MNFILQKRSDNLSLLFFYLCSCFSNFFILFLFTFIIFYIYYLLHQLSFTFIIFFFYYNLLLLSFSAFIFFFYCHLLLLSFSAFIFFFYYHFLLCSISLLSTSFFISIEFLIYLLSFKFINYDILFQLVLPFLFLLELYLISMILLPLRHKLLLTILEFDLLHKPQ